MSRRRPVPTREQTYRVVDALTDRVYDSVEDVVEVGEYVLEYINSVSGEELESGRGARHELQEAYMSLREALARCERAARKLE